MSFEQLPAIDSDVACIGCGYLLRGLNREGNCPECGKWICFSTLHAAKTNSNHAKQLHFERRLCVATQWAGLKEERAALLAWYSLHCAFKNRPTETSEIKASEICKAFLNLLPAWFGDTRNARKTLRVWGLSNSMMLGTMLFWLVTVSLVEKAQGDIIDDFKGLFDLETGEQNLC